MARLPEYSRNRFYLMQGALWVVLLASMGLAALVSRRAVRSELGEPVRLDSATVRLPADWIVEQDDGSESGGAGVRATEPVRPPWQRQVVVTERLPGLFERLAPLASSAPERSIDFGAARGGYTVQRAVARMGFQRVDIVTVTATGELPTGRRITISMEELDPDATAVERNVTLVKQIAASVEQAGPRQPPGIQAR